MNMERPHDLHTVRAFLGLTSYFRRYIPGFAAIAAPLERLKQKGVAFRWNDDCDVAFRQLQRALVKPPILVYPNFKKRFKIYVDSSHLAAGACLVQEVDKRDRAIAYASKMLVGSQRNWINKTSGTTEIECWGIVWATRKFRCYLDHAKFDLFTDHQALTWIFGDNTRTSNAKLVRWAMELSQLRFKVHHRPGTSMGHADGLSRLYDRPGASVVGVIRMSDILNTDENDASIIDGTQPQDGMINRNATDVPVAVGESNVTPSGEPAEGVPPSEEAPMGTEPLTQAEQEEDLQGRTQEADRLRSMRLDWSTISSWQSRCAYLGCEL
ncbi:hypothetical protein PI124_g17146 [Phytophthora idaei]|nr:hypothetical protein PI125_g18451 [Phytophthora idaei]KAG3137865.1 hypothetical protein PI126_g17183 [Phytophthora idaei]KAG3237880.1 hypothetical protein PI124_g17146 [Phytophthora idaei]